MGEISLNVMRSPTKKLKKFMFFDENFMSQSVFIQKLFLFVHNLTSNVFSELFYKYIYKKQNMKYLV